MRKKLSNVCNKCYIYIQFSEKPEKKINKQLSVMKRFLTVAAAMLAASFALTAQEKGDFTVGGSLGISGGSHSVSNRYEGTTTTSDYKSPTTFNIAPSFSYFVIDNLEVSAGLDYSMSTSYDETNKDNTYTTNIALFTLGANYYIPIADKLYYTPGISFGFGGGSEIEKTDGTKYTVKRPFDFAFTMDFGKFEYKPMDCLGITANIFNLAVCYSSVYTGVEGLKTSTTDLSVNISAIRFGVKYYF